MNQPLKPPVGFKIYTHEIDSPVGRVNVGALTQEAADWAKRALENNESLVTTLRECMTWIDESDPDHESARRNFNRVLREAVAP